MYLYGQAHLNAVLIVQLTVLEVHSKIGKTRQIRQVYIPDEGLGI